MIVTEELDWPSDTSTNCRNQPYIERCLGRDLEAFPVCNLLSIAHLGENLGRGISGQAEDETKKNRLFRPARGRASSGRRAAQPG